MTGKEIDELKKIITDITITYLHQCSNESEYTKMMSEIHKTAEKYADKNIPKSERNQMDCQAGCSICCRVNVPVLMPEALLIKQHIIKTLSPEELTELIAKMEEILPQIRYLEEDERILSNKECVFLDENGACSIYSVRPLMCRSVTSADSVACKQAMTMLAMNEQVFVPMNIMQKSIMDTAFRTLAKSLKQCRINDKSRELTDAIYTMLKG